MSLRAISARPLVVVSFLFGIITPILVLASEGDSLTIFVTGSLRGRAGGCVCPGGGYGGLDRRQTAINNQFEGIDYFGIDCGGFLDLDPEGGQQASLCTMLGLKRMGLKAAFVGMRDLFYGEKFLRSIADSAGVPLISANLIDSRTGAAVFLPWIEFEHSAKLFAITGIAEHQPERRYPGPGNITSISPDSVIKQLRETIPENADFIVLLTDMSEANLRDFLPEFTELDIVFTSSRKIDSTPPFEIAGITVVKPMRDGGALDGVVITTSENDDFQPRVFRTILKEDVTPDVKTKNWLEGCLSGQ